MSCLALLKTMQSRLTMSEQVRSKLPLRSKNILGRTQETSEKARGQLQETSCARTGLVRLGCCRNS